MRQRTVLQSVPNLACSRDVYPRDIRLLPIGAAHGSLAGVLRVSRPPSNARVAPRKVSVVVQRAGRELARVETDGNTFRVADLDPGRYSVQITGTGVYAEIWDITVGENLETEYEFPLSLCPRLRSSPTAQRRTRRNLPVMAASHVAPFPMIIGKRRYRTEPVPEFAHRGARRGQWNVTPLHSHHSRNPVACNTAIGFSTSHDPFTAETGQAIRRYTIRGH